MKFNEWCTNCKEYDKDKHCCPRFNNVIRHTLNDSINAVLDKIAAEIEQIAKDYDKFDDLRRVRGLWIAIEIIDKHRAESEDEG